MFELFPAVITGSSVTLYHYIKARRLVTNTVHALVIIKVDYCNSDSVLSLTHPEATCCCTRYVFGEEMRPRRATIS